MKLPASQQRRWRLRAMTLIEVLAVVCLIALAAALTLNGLGAASAAAQLRTALAECRQLDARARLLARAEGPMVITAGPQHDLLVVDPNGTESTPTTPPLLRVQTTNEWTIHLNNRAGQEVKHIRIDAQGRSDDYTIELRLPASDATADSQTTRLLRIAGLTGWIEEGALP